jgi:hypothetical protein
MSRLVIIILRSRSRSSTSVSCSFFCSWRLRSLARLKSRFACVCKFLSVWTPRFVLTSVSGASAPYPRYQTPRANKATTAEIPRIHFHVDQLTQVYCLIFKRSGVESPNKKNERNHCVPNTTNDNLLWAVAIALVVFPTESRTTRSKSPMPVITGINVKPATAPSWWNAAKTV